MAEIGKKAYLSFELNEEAIEAPINWQELSVLATFEDDSIQANITIDKLEFVRDEATKIIDYIGNGLEGGLGIYEGLPLNITASNINSQYNIFKGYLDVSDDVVINPYKNAVIANLIKDNGLNSLDERLNALTYGWLENIGVFTDSDYKTIKYVVAKKFNAFEILTSSVILYLMIKELAEATKDTTDAIANAQAHLSGGVTGTVAAAIYAVAVAIIQVAYTTLLLAQVIKLGTDLINTFIQPKRKAKAISLYNLISKVATYLEYEIEIGSKEKSELENVYYLPSNLQVDELGLDGFITRVHGTLTGIPNTRDVGYSVGDMFTIARQVINGKIAIINDVMHFRNVHDEFWIRSSDYILPDVQLTEKRYNTNELIANKVIEFITDLSDEWTIYNYKGTIYEVITDAITVKTKRFKTIKGLSRNTIPCALGNSKKTLDAFEKFLKSVANTTDSVISQFGGRGNLEDQINISSNVLKIANNNYNIPKLIKYSGDSIVERNDFSAKYIYNNYYLKDSFVQENFYGQKEVYNDIEIPFGFEDFLKVINNSYFYNQDGEEGKFISLEWNIYSDTAKVSFWIRKPFTKNLKEATIEP